LWKREFFETDVSKTTRGISTCFLDVSFNSQAGIAVVLLKQVNATAVDMSCIKAQGIDILCDCSTNILTLDTPGEWATESGKVDCVRTNDMRIKLKDVSGKAATFKWRRTKWLLLKPDEE
jgi:hypothetical protein